MENLNSKSSPQSYIPPTKPITLKKSQKLRNYSKKVNKFAPYGRDEKGTAYLNIELREGQTHAEYIAEIEKTAPFGRDPNGKAHLIPMRNIKEVAWRVDMEHGSDHGSFYKSGLGWKLNPTMFIAIILLLPNLIGIPFLNLIFGDINDFRASILQELNIALPFLALIFFLVLFIKYCNLHLEELIKPYGKNSSSLRMLFVNDLEFLKFSKQLSWDVFNMKWLYLGFLGFLIYQPFGLSNIIIPGYWQVAQPGDIPYIFSFITIPSSILYGLLIVMIFGFIVAIFVGLFSLADLSKDRTKLSINSYGEMISSLNNMLIIAQNEKKRLVDMDLELNVSGRTYYEFQRGNRKIGEYLFNIATILIGLCIAVAVAIWIIEQVGLLPEVMASQIFIMYIIVFIFGVLSLTIFILPQFKLHHFLKDFKYTLIDQFASLSSRLEFIYFESLKEPAILDKIDDRWSTRHILAEDMNFIKQKSEEVKSYGTWSYDFPEVLKLVLVVASTLIPIILPFFGIQT